ncbi:MAG: four helix bundle protein [Saprospiraceae bacterium]
MKAKTKKFAIDVTHLCDTLPPSQSIRTISFQLIKSAPPTGPNCRAACRARSKAEFYSKLCITVEEADESQYWLYSKRSGFWGGGPPNPQRSGVEIN